MTLHNIQNSSCELIVFFCCEVGWRYWHGGGYVKVGRELFFEVEGLLGQDGLVGWGKLVKQ